MFEDKPFVTMVPAVDSQSPASKDFTQYYIDLCAALAEPDVTLEEGRRWFNRWGDYGFEPTGVSYNLDDLNGVTCMWADSEGCDQDRVLLCVHGGGYTYGSMYSHRKGYATLAKALGIRGLLVNYRNTPESDWPAPSDDVLAVYKELLKRGYKPEHIAVTGDSCGGAMSITLALRIREEGLPMLACIMPISPWCDLEATFPIYDTNDKDVLNPKEAIIAFGDVLKNAGIDVRDPHLAPMYIEDMTGFAPMYITVGGYENFVDEDVYVGDIAYRSGVEVKVDIVAEMQHSFQQICGGCKDADDQIARFAAWARPKLGL